MWLNNMELFSGNLSYKNSYDLTKEEANQAITFIKQNYYFMQNLFDNYFNELFIEIEEREKKEKKYLDEYLLAYKAMVTMKENWATTLDVDELNKFSNNITFPCDIEHENKKINELKEGINIKEQEDIIEAEILSEKIKNWDY